MKQTIMLMMLMISIGIAETISLCDETSAPGKKFSQCVTLVGTQCSTNRECAQSLNLTCIGGNCIGLL